MSCGFAAVVARLTCGVTGCTFGALLILLILGLPLRFSSSDAVPWWRD
jgi:hypothetical protein